MWESEYFFIFISDGKVIPSFHIIQSAWFKHFSGNYPNFLSSMWNWLRI